MTSEVAMCFLVYTEQLNVERYSRRCTERRDSSLCALNLGLLTESDILGRQYNATIADQCSRISHRTNRRVTLITMRVP